MTDRATQDRLADGQRCLEAALRYLKRGWSVLALCHPEHVGFGRGHGKCDSPGKRPWHSWKEFQDRLPTEDELAAWWREHPNSNVGLALGPVSGLIRIDVEGEAGERRLAELSAGDLPDTLEFVSGRTDSSGRGLLYRIPDGVSLRTTTEKTATKQELRLQAKGAQTVLPPSRHSSGNLYSWKPGKSPEEIEPAEAPGWLIRELSDGYPRLRRSELGEDEKIDEGERNDTLASLAGSMRRRGMTEAAMAAALLVENEERCNPPLSEEEVRTIARSVARYKPEEEEDETPLVAPDHVPTETVKPEVNGVHVEAKTGTKQDEPPLQFPQGSPPDEEKRQIIAALRGRKSFKNVPLQGVRKLGRGNDGAYELIVDHEWATEIPIIGDILVPGNVQRAVAQCIGIVMPVVKKSTWCNNEAKALLRIAGIGEDIGIGPRAELIAWITQWTGDAPFGDPGITIDTSDKEALFKRLEVVKTQPFFWDTHGRLYLSIEALMHYVNVSGWGPIRRDPMIVRLRREGFDNDVQTAQFQKKRKVVRMWFSKPGFSKSVAHVAH